jgi:hypothetical protein
MQIVDVFVKGEHKTQIGKKKIVDIKSSMNDHRMSFT